MITRDFLTAGEAIFTVEVPETFRVAQALLGNEWHEHYTYRIQKVEMKATDKFPARVAYFVSSLTGPDNTSDYTYLGEMKADGKVRLTTKSAFPETATRVVLARKVLAAICEGRGDQITAAGWVVRHNGYCGRCARLLTVPASVESGFGPECIQQVMGCTLGMWSRKQEAKKATEVVAVA